MLYQKLTHNTEELGVKVWICKGEVFGKRDLSPNFVKGGAKGPRDNKGGNRKPRRR